MIIIYSLFPPDVTSVQEEFTLNYNLVYFLIENSINCILFLCFSEQPGFFFFEWQAMMLPSSRS